MALQKQPVQINFSQGLDTKSDKNQLPLGKFETLVNSIFDTAGRLTKRNGFKKITTLPNTDQTTLTTLNGNLIATGTDLYAYNQQTNAWLDQGSIQPVTLAVQPVIRNSFSQTGADSVVASNGLACVVYMEGSNQSYYNVFDSKTGESMISRVQLPHNAVDPRVNLLGRYFIITYKCTISAAVHLQYIAVPIMLPSVPGTATDIATGLLSIDAGYDAYAANNNLFIAYSDAGPATKLTFLTQTLVLHAPATAASKAADLVSVTVDTTVASPVVWVTIWDASSSNLTTQAFDSILNPVLANTAVVNGVVLNHITSVAQDMAVKIFYDINNNYAAPYPTSIQTDFIRSVSVTSAGVVGTPATILRSVGLASKAFIADSGTTYMLVAYGETSQPTYFLIDSLGNIIMRLAYSNGGGYISRQVLPNVSFYNDMYSIAYLFKDFLTTVNKGTDNPSGTPSAAIYTNTGVNLASFSINSTGQYSSEIANALHLTGGQFWEYDGVKPVEHGFQVWPENVQVATNGAGGSILAQVYYYQFCYEWTDNVGNLHRSAPSIPVTITTTGSTSTNTLYVPTLRLTYKDTPNAVRIVGYRWSVGQQIYYQFTSVANPTLNDKTVDFVTITDTHSDASILGNAILYTTGGVVENIAAPASVGSALFKNRLFLIDAEDRNLLWYSKQVIEAVPVEMSDLFTIFVAPTTGAQGSTGPVTALSAMDDKLIIFKSNAIYYVTGTGPDNTGANNDFSDPIFITGSVGCDNPSSVVLMQQGLMFQSEKGIWLLGRDLSTNYIGAPVEAFNSNVVKKAESIPATNQVRFILDNNVTLMFDYFYQQWGSFTNIRAVSSTIYQTYHTYLNSLGQVLQETPGTYLDGSSPVLMSFKTGPLSLAGLRGYERFYFLFLLGTYYSPFKLNVGLAYDYNQSAEQTILVTPDNFTEPWGGEAVWGSGQNWGGVGNVFSARLFPQKQKCQTFTVSMQESYDGSLGVDPGQGLALSGMNVVIGLKKGYSVQKASRSFG